jgi:hypothetical protein
MSERRVVFADWIGQAVVVLYPGGMMPADYGVLEEVNDWGLVLRSTRTISWSTEESEFGGQEDFVRSVLEFHPWHMVSRVRVLEPEEKEAHGL